jgi:hypothetical protein
MRIVVILIYLAVFLIAARTGGAHEPITTKVMFNKEIIRILQRNCLGCHSPGKIKADVPLTTYEEARPWAKAIKEEILEKRMMPYQSVKGYGSFQHDYVLPQRDVDLLVSWIEGGAPRGEEKDYPKQAIEELITGDAWPLGQPDLILQPEKEVKIAAEVDNQVHCFVLPTKLNQDKWINALDFLPGNAEIVYNATFYLAPQSKTGDVCGRDSGESFGEWVPGQGANRLPQGIARLLPANSRIVVKIRYLNNGGPAVDRSRIGLYFSKSQINKSVRKVTIGAPETKLSTNAERHRIRTSFSIAEPTDLVAIRPLLFPFAESIEATAHRPDGTIEVLIWARSYRHDWQPSYYFRKPVPLPKGTRIDVTAYLDNSDKPARFADALCEITLTSSLQMKRAMR